MAVEWTQHRFAGGVLALDVANTVVLRIDPKRRFDRFQDAREIDRFAAAASEMRADELKGSRLTVGKAPKADVLRLRETIDALFRDAVQNQSLESEKLSKLLGACSMAMIGAGRLCSDGRPQSGMARLEPAVAMSALSLLDASRLSRIRICGNCGWLFLDRSRNGSRIWCDMAVCGNRQKAARHYLRHKDVEAVDDNALG